MKISFEKLESTIYVEIGKPRVPRGYYADLFEQAYPALYVAAKFGEIDALDALISCRHDVELTAMIARNFLTADDIPAVKKVIQMRKDDALEYVNRIEENFILESWLTDHET